MARAINKMNNIKGRPRNSDRQALQKAKLIAAAQELLSETSYSNITIREVAQRSEVNSAMVSYYFNNKEGLFIALLDKMSAKHFTNMQAIAKSANPVKALISTILAMLNNNNGLARLIHSEFIEGNSTISHAFIERFPKKMATFLPQLILKNTSITDKQKAKYAAFSLITMIITPFINKSIRQLAWQISDEELQSPLWVEHIYQQFMFGCNEQLNANANNEILKHNYNAGQSEGKLS
ncbi:MAG: hypothetical protein COB83_09250 [Gammaproteobacteria bacterium]|nr:MAG: hypothetical protein COB83_09250 [Gammaproteobacteria bacterium]